MGPLWAPIWAVQPVGVTIDAHFDYHDSITIVAYYHDAITIVAYYHDAITILSGFLNNDS